LSAGDDIDNIALPIFLVAHQQFISDRWSGSGKAKLVG
jgi:hypothetical protein